MALQFRYQRAKLYREVAMGTKHHMAISQDGLAPSEIKTSGLKKRLLMCLVGVYVSSDSSFSAGQDHTKCILLVLQLFQLYNGYTLMQLYFTEADCATWQVPVLGVLFFIVALMNSSTLTSVVKSKKPQKKSA